MNQKIIDAMKQTMQSGNTSVLDHGYLVRAQYLEIIAFLKGEGEAQDWWRLPTWLDKTLLDKVYPDKIMEEYQIYHDCGKPYCLITDEDGKRHFPNHAKISQKIWEENGGDPTAASLMGMDMDAHLLRSEDILEFSKRPVAISLLITAVAEVHANAKMMQGTDSDSFKIKSKHLQKKGKLVIDQINKA